MLQHRAVSTPNNQHVLGKDIPRENTRALGSVIDAPSDYDHPDDYGFGDTYFSLRLLPIGEVVANSTTCHQGVHGAHCYSAARFLQEAPGHDISPPEWDCPPGHESATNFTSDDQQYVESLIEHADQLPPLLLLPTPDGSALGMWGGGHRTAAWADAGMQHIPCWVPD